MGKIIIKKFNELTVDELYNILKLRCDVFVVEQNCVYREIDGKDKNSLHFMLKEKEDIVAYIRILPKNMSYETVSLGRVVVASTARGKHYASEIVQAGIEYIVNVWKEKEITIGAQVYLIKFYESLGFREISDHYLEDGIPHVDMRYTTK